MADTTTTQAIQTAPAAVGSAGTGPSAFAMGGGLKGLSGRLTTSLLRGEIALALGVVAVLTC